MNTWRFWCFIVTFVYVVFRFVTIVLGLAPFSWTVLFAAITPLYFGFWVWDYYKAASRA